MSKLPDDKREIFADVYRYYEKYHDAPDTVEAWEDRARELGELCNKHSSPLANQLFLACYYAMDEEIKEVRRAIEHVC